MSLLRRFLRLFFWHFYHGFAWTYDIVAAVVSIGRWNDWVRAALPYVEGTRILEIGHGPGHLQVDLRQAGRQVIAMDESLQMGRLARDRLLRHRFTELNLVRGIAQRLPFATGVLDTVVSTFPAEFIFELQTISEIRRVLREGGCYVLVPAAWIVGRKRLDRLAAWLFHSTKQVPELPAQEFSERLCAQLEQVGFRTQAEAIQVRASEVLVIIGRV